jgi:hypothetical protein
LFGLSAGASSISAIIGGGLYYMPLTVLFTAAMASTAATGALLNGSTIRMTSSHPSLQKVGDLELTAR